MKIDFSSSHPNAIDQNKIPRFRLSSGAGIPVIGIGTYHNEIFTFEEVAKAVYGAVKAGYRLVDCAAGYLENVSDVRAAEQVLGAHLAELAGAGQAVVREKGYDYAVRASLGTSHFPTKTYDGFALPAGDYRALRVTIGAGEGRNWWCVVFPALCVSAASEWQDTAVSGGLSGEDVRLMAEEDEGYVLRFKCLELWDKLSQKCSQS